MTIKDYIQQKFQAFGVELSEADLFEMCIKMGKSGEDEMDQSSLDIVSVAMAEFIPSLLLRPNSINENGFSVSYDSKGIKEYYSVLCKQYGLEDKLNNRPKVKFFS